MDVLELPWLYAVSVCLRHLYCLRLATAEDLAQSQAYEEAGTDIAQLLNKKDNITKQKAAMSPAVAKALAKLANGLYVVTAAHSAEVS